MSTGAAAVKKLVSQFENCVMDLEKETVRVRQHMEQSADLTSNLGGEFASLDDLIEELDQIIDGLKEHDVDVKRHEDCRDFFAMSVRGRRNYADLIVALNAVKELREIQCLSRAAGTDLIYSRAVELIGRCDKVTCAILNGNVKLPADLGTELEKIRSKILTATAAAFPQNAQGEQKADESFSSSAVLSAQPFLFEGQGRGLSRLDERLLPTFCGNETNYSNFKDVFKRITAGLTDEYLQLVLASERVIKNQELRDQLVPIKTHQEQWAHLDALFSSKSRQLLCLFKRWSEKDRLSSPSSIITALAELKGTMTVLEEMVDGDETIPTSRWLKLLLLSDFSKKLPKEVQDKVNNTLGSMDSPEVKKILDVLEEHRGALLVGGYSQQPKKRAAAAAASIGNARDAEGSPRQKSESPSCTYHECNGKHFLYKCSKFQELPVPDRKKFIQQIGACTMCLNKGHSVAQCPRFEALGTCKIDGCDGQHSRMLHETVGHTEIGRAHV